MQARMWLWSLSLALLPIELGPSDSHAVVQAVLASAAGSNATDSITFDQNDVVKGQFMLVGKEARFDLSGPSGPLVLSEPAQQKLEKDVVLHTFTIASPPTGKIVLRLTSGTTSPAELRYNLTFANGRTLGIQLNPMSAEPNQPIELSARVVDQHGTVLIPDTAGSNLSTVTVTLPDQSTQTISLFDDGAHGDGSSGDGVFGGSFAGTAQSGRYSVAGHAIIRVGSAVIERTGRSLFVVTSRNATFAGAPVVSTPDANKDGRFDALVISQPVNFKKNGSFRAIATLVDGKGGTISHLSADYTNTQGACSGTIVFSAPGPEIVRHGVDGPWIVRGLRIADVDAGSLLCDSAADFTTKTLPANAFERPSRPNISGIIPSDGPFAGGGTAVVHGSGMTGVTSVTIGGNAAVFVVNGDDVIQVTVPKYEPVPPPKPPSKISNVPVDVKVVGPWGTSTKWGGYEYRQ